MRTAMEPPRRAPLVALLVTLPCLGAAPAPSDDHVFVVTSDPSAGTGNCAAFDLTRPWKDAVNLEATAVRPVVRHFFGRHYVVHPDAGAIQVIDPATFDTVLQFSVGAGSQPRDILVVDTGSAYVSRHASSLVYEVDPATGALLDTVDLGPLADADGVPEMAMMARDGHRLFVQLQRLDRAGLPVPPSLLAVVDMRTNELVDVDPARPGVQGISLAWVMPDFKMQVEEAERRLYLSEPGSFHDAQGGIEAVDLDTLTALGFITDESQVALDISGFILTSPTRGYVITHTDLVQSSHLQPFSRIDGSGLGPELHVSFAQVDHLAHDSRTDQLFFPDPDADGVRVYDATTQQELPNAPIPAGGDPVDLDIARVVTPGEASGLRVASLDPATGDLSLTFRPACGASDHTLVYGPLAEVGTYGYTGQGCHLGSKGGVAGFNPGPGSFFFLIGGHDESLREGSYGRSSALAERPEDTGDPVCPLTQDLTLRCD